MASREQRRSADLLQPPKGPGVAFVLKELQGREGKRKHCGPPKTFRVAKSTAISRAQLLLPLLASAEQQLQQRLSTGQPDSVDVENVEDDELHVEMDLALVPLSSQDGEEEASSESSSDSESEGEGEREGGDGAEEVKMFPLKLPTSVGHKRRCAAIEELPCR